VTQKSTGEIHFTDVPLTPKLSTISRDTRRNERHPDDHKTIRRVSTRNVEALNAPTSNIWSSGHRWATLANDTVVGLDTWSSHWSHWYLTLFTHAWKKIPHQYLSQ